MLDILRVHLNDTETPEFGATIEESIKLFDDFGNNVYEQDITQILMTDDHTDSEAGDTNAHLEKFCRNLLGQMLRDHSIYIDESASLIMHNTIARAVYDLQHYETADNILAILASDGSNLTMFADLCQLVCPESPDTILTVLEEVQDAFIERVREVFAEETPTMEFTEEQGDGVLEAVTRFKDFLNYLGDVNLVAADMVRSDTPIARPFSMYVEMVGRDFENMDPVIAAYNLIAFAYLSSDAYNNPKKAIIPVLEDVIASLNTITRITIALTDTLTRYEIHVSKLKTNTGGDTE